MTPSDRREPVSRSVPGFKRDDDVRCFRLVKLETSRVVVAPAGKIHDLGRLSRRPGGSLGRLHDTEPIAVEEERVFPEQVVELWNHGVVVGNGPGFELPQSALDLCGREFHCTLLSIRSPQGDERLSLEEYDSILEVAQNDPEVREKFVSAFVLRPSNRARAAAPWEEHVEPVRAQVSEAATAELGGIEHPGLPVQQTVKLELVVNLKPRKRSASQYRKHCRCRGRSD